MCSLCFPTCRKLCIAQHPHFPTDSDTGKLVTQGYFAHFYSDSKLSVTCFSSEVELRYRLCFNYSQLASLTNGCLSVSLNIWLWKEDHYHTRRSFRDKALHWGLKAILRSDQTSSDCCKRRRRKKKITYSKAIVPKQVGLIIPRGPFLNLEWFVGLLEGDNWIHRELATGMHTHSQQWSANAHLHTLEQVHKCMHAQKGLFPTLRSACALKFICAHTQRGGSKSRIETGLGQAAESLFL